MQPSNSSRLPMPEHSLPLDNNTNPPLDEIAAIEKWMAQWSRNKPQQDACILARVVAPLNIHYFRFSFFFFNRLTFPKSNYYSVFHSQHFLFNPHVWACRRTSFFYLSSLLHQVPPKLIPVKSVNCNISRAQSNILGQAAIISQALVIPLQQTVTIVLPAVANITTHTMPCFAYYRHVSPINGNWTSDF